jgi:hypothetical protein
MSEAITDEELDAWWNQLAHHDKYLELAEILTVGDVSRLIDEVKRLREEANPSCGHDVAEFYKD